MLVPVEVTTEASSAENGPMLRPKELADRKSKRSSNSGGADQLWTVTTELSFSPNPINRLSRGCSGSLGRMFDHVAIAVSDLAASERFYRAVLGVLGVEPSYADAELVEWEDWDIGVTDREHPLTRGLHVGFRARDRGQVDAFWPAGVDAGYRDDGAPGPRTQYGPSYYGGFLLDPDGNSVEAVHSDRENPVPNGRVDHLWIRVRDLQASRRFYTTIAPHAGLRLAHDDPGRVQLSGSDYSFSLVRDERPFTEHVHLAFPALENSAVRSFHAAAIAAGYEDHGAPGERAVYHPGYYGAFVLDPDGHNIEVVNHNRAQVVGCKVVTIELRLPLTVLWRQYARPGEHLDGRSALRSASGRTAFARDMALSSDPRAGLVRACACRVRQR
jgi:catechol 2,3-dioxygenase-like lactoylglutathione lyase family enzyme